MEEEWRTPRTFAKYEVSDWGRVRNAKTKRILKTRIDHDGYRSIMVGVGGGKYRYPSVHSLVAAEFIGPRPEGYQINHLDGDKSNNRPSNLAYTTPVENYRHALELGLLIGNQVPITSLLAIPPRDVPLIRENARGLRDREWAEYYGVTLSCINRIRNGHSRNSRPVRTER